MIERQSWFRELYRVIFILLGSALLGWAFGYPLLALELALLVIVGYMLIILGVAFLNGCASVPGKQVADGVAPLTPEAELSDGELLNVSIQVFDPGQLPEDPDKREGLSPEIREAESRFAPICA